MSDLLIHTPVREVLGGSFRDFGGAGEMPTQLFEGLQANGLSQTAHTIAPSQDAGFDSVLKANIPAPTSSAPKLG